MADKAIYSVDTVTSMSGTDKVYVNTGNNIKQISKDDLCGNGIEALQTEVNNNTNAISEINDNLSSEISRAKEADEILKSRVDVITSLPEGSTTGDVELQDIRVKADGTTATSAGNAVREQINELKSDINNVITNSLFNFSIRQDGVYRDYTSGDIAPVPSYTLLVYTNIDVNSLYAFCNNLCDAHIVFYSSTELYERMDTTVPNYISGIVTDKNKVINEFSIPSNAKMMTISLFTVSINETTFLKSDDLPCEDVILNGKLILTSLKNLPIVRLEKCRKQSGQYYQYDDGVISELESYTAYWVCNPFIDYDYTLFSKNTHVTFFNNLNPIQENYISGVVTDGENTLRVPDNCKLMIVSCRKDDTNKILTIGNFDVNKKQSKKIIYVEKDGSGDFIKLTDALAYGMENENTTIYLGSGTYDIIEELGDSYFENFSYIPYANMGPVIGNGTHLICSSKSSIECHYNGYNDEVKSGFSPFNPPYSEKGTGYIIENATINCSNVRYCIHDDIGFRISPYKHEYIRCKMNIDNSNRLIDGNLSGMHHCIGGGMGVCGTIVIDSCYFDGKGLPSSDLGVVAYHNGDNAIPSKGSIVIKNSYCAGNNTIMITDHSSTTLETPVILNGNSVGSEIIHNKVSEDNPENMKIYEWNNEVRSN